jgi:predicted lipid-binding transport protein (Tim44 family)
MGYPTFPFGPLPSTTTLPASTETVTVASNQEGLNSNSSPNPSQSATASAQNLSRKLSGGVIAGIAVGCISGVGFLGLAAFLLFRRKRRQSSPGPDINPFTDDVSRETVRPISAEKDALTIVANDKRQSADPLQLQHVTAPHRPITTTSTNGQIPPPPVRGMSTTTIVNADNSRTGDETGAGTGSIDILQLFEERTFESHLLHLISQRMDPAPSFEDEATLDGVQRHTNDGLPAYRLANEEG